MQEKDGIKPRHAAGHTTYYGRGRVYKKKHSGGYRRNALWILAPDTPPIQNYESEPD